jgi:hypothetical protein
MEFAHVLKTTGTNLTHNDKCETVIKYEKVIHCRTCSQDYVYFDMIA